MPIKKERNFLIKNPEVLANCLAYVAGLDHKPNERGEFFIVQIKHGKPLRSEAQHGLYRLWVRHFRRELMDRGMSPTAITELGLALELQKAFLGEEDIETPSGWITQVRSTKGLSVKEMAAFLTEMEAYILTTYDISLPHPEDVYYLSLGIKQPANA